MDYQEASEFLLDLRRFGVSPGTESVRDLLADLGDPHEGVAFVQVAGSNGKGSTARMVESCLREAGYRVGLYTSPHLDDLRERVRVDGRKVPRTAVASFVDRARPFLVDRAARGDPLTFFEAMTALALWQFDRADCDVAVLEVGLGGRYDATSVVDPAAAAVTNVSLEHTEVLGDTVEAIAAEKAAVAPGDRPLVTAATGEGLDALRDEVRDLITVGEERTDPDVRVAYRGRTATDESAVEVGAGEGRIEARVPVLGACQARNAGVATTLARQVAAALDGPAVEDALARGLRSAHWPGRFEVMGHDPLTVLDGAHNPEACAATAATLGEFEFEDLHVVFAAMHEKDHAGMVEVLPTPDSVRTCAPTLDRAEDPAVLAAVWERETEAGVVESGDAVGDALRAARTRADADDCVLVVGSLFAVAEAREDWTRAVRPVAAGDGDAAAARARDAGAPTAEVERVREHADGRTVAFRLGRRRAERLRAIASDAGVAPAVRAGRADGELVDVVLAGPRDCFRALVAALDGAGDALSGVAADLRRTLGFDDGRPRHGYPWEDGTAVMGILNVTPDSFHDGGDFFDPSDAVERADEMAAAGADVIDVGGESTRPGAEPVSVAEELDRVLPVIEAIAGTDALVSVDTRKAEVGRAALDAGAHVLNDVTGLADPEMRFLASEREVPVVVMHSIDAPVVPGKEVTYDDVVAEVIDELRERVLLAVKAGVPREKVIVDPGFGFGKSAAENFELLDRVGELRALGCPVLIGHSHKSMFDLIGRGAGERLPATVAATALAADRGADLVRVHDVPENVAAVRTALAARESGRVENDE